MLGGACCLSIFLRVLQLVLLLLSHPCEAAGFFETFMGSKKKTSLSSSSPSSAATALKPGDTVAVIGASGNVGKLVALRLSDTYKVNGVVRRDDAGSSVAPFFGDRLGKSINLYTCDLLQEMNNKKNDSTTTFPAPLVAALKNANCIVICTGTTAFPTKAWSRSGSENAAITGDVLKALLDNQFSLRDAVTSLDELGFNTPNNVDDRANAFVLQAWDAVCETKQKRAIMLSSIGVERRAQMPFPILNAAGVLDAKAAGEAVLKNAASRGGYSYTILRPGQLFGGPYDNNYYLGTLFQLDKDATTQNVQVNRGDSLLGDTLRSTLAEVTAQVCEGNYAMDMDFAVINVNGDCPSVQQVQERLAAL
jgi:nucleoside-diphosphate-sugar epimerase